MNIDQWNKRGKLAAGEEQKQKIIELEQEIIDIDKELLQLSKNRLHEIMNKNLQGTVELIKKHAKSYKLDKATNETELATETKDNEEASDGGS